MKYTTQQIEALKALAHKQAQAAEPELSSGIIMTGRIAALYVTLAKLTARHQRRIRAATDAG